LILFAHVLLEGSWRFMLTTRSRGIEASITRSLAGSMVTAMIESVRYGASFW